MSPMKLLSSPEIASRVKLATVGESDLKAKRRDNQLKNTSWWMVRTLQFTNTKDSAWSIVDTILGISPTGIKLCYIQDELDKIYDSLPKHFPKMASGVFGFFSKLFAFTRCELLFLFLGESF